MGQVQPTVGTGVFELRVRADGAYRVFYVVKFAEGMYVLHAFHKKGGADGPTGPGGRDGTVSAAPRAARGRLRSAEQWRSKCAAGAATSMRISGSTRSRPHTCSCDRS
ncbi:MAG: type II toxin-antitoxin system RelE/ParE family toxin [Gemmatimonadaceae bacterium]|nr:type II toxin-antitoxin system RelE/ParE family toxin [Gemmatimonadaceae bacterium]